MLDRPARFEDREQSAWRGRTRLRLEMLRAPIVQQVNTQGRLAPHLMCVKDALSCYVPPMRLPRARLFFELQYNFAPPHQRALPPLQTQASSQGP